MNDLVGRAKAALEGVTDGPWTFGVRNSRTVQIVPGDRPSLLRPEPGLAGIALARPEDAAFIAASRTLVPELIDLVEELQSIVDADDGTAARIHREWTETRRRIKRIRALCATQSAVVRVDSVLAILNGEAGEEA